MANQGYPFEGSDHRVFGKFGAWLQRHTTFMSNIPPPFATVEFLGVRLGFPWRVKGEWRVWHWRIHIFRYDVYNKAYIGFSAMGKKVPPTEVAP